MIQKSKRNCSPIEGWDGEAFPLEHHIVRVSSLKKWEVGKSSSEILVIISITYLHVHVFIPLCVCVCAWVHAHAWMCMSMWKSEFGVGCLPPLLSTLCLQAESLTEPTTHQLAGWADRPVSSRKPTPPRAEVVNAGCRSCPASKLGLKVFMLT